MNLKNLTFEQLDSFYKLTELLPDCDETTILKITNWHLNNQAKEVRRQLSMSKALTSLGLSYKSREYPI